MNNKVSVYKQYAELTGDVVKNLIGVLQSNFNKDTVVIEPGCGPGIRGLNIVRNLEFKKYFGIEKDALGKGELEAFKEKLVKLGWSLKEARGEDNSEFILENGSREVHLVKKDFLEWTYLKGDNENIVVILSFFLHWLFDKWVDGGSKVIDLSPDVIILIGGGMPSFPVHGIKFLLPFYKDIIKKDIDLAELNWLFFLLDLQKYIESVGLNLNTGLSAADYLSRIELFVENGYRLKEEIKDVSFVKEFEHEFVLQFYKEDPLNLFPYSEIIKDEVIKRVKEYLQNLQETTGSDKVNWRHLLYVAVLGH